ncbi:MAG TPA: PIN domain-containing protein [Ruminiclostridium sp.]
MKVLLDTNIIIHRESSTVVNEDIGILFRWLDELKYDKCIHPLTIEEITKNKDQKAVRTFKAKMESYYVLKTQAPINDKIKEISSTFDKNINDQNDTKLLNEVYANRVDILITEDKKIHLKANKLGIPDKVLYIDSFIDSAIAENPTLINYKIQSVKQELFGNINLEDTFFKSFKEDYVDFSKWFNKKADETAYVCMENNSVTGFLYLKTEDKKENYSNILPAFLPKKRLKIGTFKVTLNGFKIGERFMKIIFDNALHFKINEIYVTIFNKTIEQQRLIRLLQEYGFIYHGNKITSSGDEQVFVREFTPSFNKEYPKKTFPYVTANNQAFFVPIYPAYHTELLPDSILNTESPEKYENNESYRNAISKVYVSRSLERNLSKGDIIIFYRTGGYYKSVITTLGIVENIIQNISSEADFIRLCRRRSVFTDKELRDQWNYNRNNRPFIVNFLYTYSFPRLINMEKLIQMEIISDVNSAPRGFCKISQNQFLSIIKETSSNENLIIDKA